jgi:glutamate-1-semialdehyde 2,1-aminomutase/spore coat polysaccharide biosynthesis protein SpsF
MLNVKKSQNLLKRAYEIIPGATQTFSKGANQWPRGIAPHYLAKGEGAWVWDIDGNKYLDHLMALGSVILGYGNQEVNIAIKKQVDEGTVFSQMHPIEVELAEKLVATIPSAEMVKFCKNGSDATTAAIRAARAYTGRDYVAYCGYHGWHDWYIANTTRSAGIPEFNKKLAYSFIYNDINSLSSLFVQHSNKFAAVIMEPVGVEIPKPEFLQKVKELCDKNGVVLIFDEVVTGFRLHIGGYQSVCGVVPNLSCFGKAMANGMPLSVVVGCKDIMKLFETHLFVSGTFSGETASIAASCKTIDVLIRDKCLDHIRDYATTLCNGIKNVISQYQMDDYIKVLGFPQRSILSFKDKGDLSLEAQKTFFMQECIKENLLYFCSHVPCASHGENELSFALNVFEKAMYKFSDAIKKGNLLDCLEAEIIESVFRKP